MNSILAKPYRPIWLTIPVIIGMTIAGVGNTLDIQLHASYFVFGLVHLGTLFITILGLIGLIYWLVRRKNLISWMTFAHVCTTILAMLTITGIGLMGMGAIDHDAFQFRNQLSLKLFIAIILSQLIFLPNLLIGLMRTKEEQGK